MPEALRFKRPKSPWTCLEVCGALGLVARETKLLNKFLARSSDPELQS